MSSETTTSSVAELYQEQHRPQLHFSPKEKWMNDPNGMVYFEGEYHLFYQYYPDSTVWGPMHWGHAISKDLIHWDHLPIALYPDSLGYIFSGSAVVDRNNTTGFGTLEDPPLVAIFTYHDTEGEKAKTDTFQSQAIAYSNDKGRTWTKYAGNPVIPNPGIRDFRDPKVIWDNQREQWVMVLAAQDQIKIYGSKNLKEWQHLSDFGKIYGSHAGVWECPDLFPLEMDNQLYWVLLLSINPGGPNGGSATQYFVGDFDGKKFRLHDDFRPLVEKTSAGVEQAVWLDYGRDNYAGVTWSDIPAADGRRIFLGWMSNWDYANVVPTEAWRSAMTLPRTLALYPSNTGPKLRQQWVDELQFLAGEPHQLQHDSVSSVLTLIEQAPGEAILARLTLDIQLIDDPPDRMGLLLQNDQGEEYRLGYDRLAHHFFSDRRKAGEHSFSEQFAQDLHLAPHQVSGDNLRLEIIIDRSSIELLAQDGKVALTELFFPTTDFHKASFFSEEGRVQLAATRTNLRPIW